VTVPLEETDECLFQESQVRRLAQEHFDASRLCLLSRLISEVAGQKDNRHIRTLGAHRRSQLNAIADRQMEICQEKVDGVTDGVVQRLLR